jgi:predicted transcriptional regulator
MSIQKHLNEMMGFEQEEVIVEQVAISDDELVQLSVINYGTILPNKVDPKIRKKLVSSGYIDNKGDVTNTGKAFLKDKKTIKRLSKIAN